MALVGVTGYATAGKDEVANILCRNFGFHKISCADPLRRDMMILNPFVGYIKRWWGRKVWYRYQDALEEFGYGPAKELFPELRRLLQVYGTDVHRTVDPDVWVKRMRAMLRPGTHYVVPDVRFGNEAQAVDFLIHVTRPGVGPLNHHESEKGLAFPFAHTIVHNDTDLQDLEAKVVNIMLRLDKPGLQFAYTPTIETGAD